MNLLRNFLKHTSLAALAVLVVLSLSLEVLAAGVPPTNSTTSLDGYDFAYGGSSGAPAIIMTDDAGKTAPYTKQGSLDGAYFDDGVIYLLSLGEVTPEMQEAGPSNYQAAYVFTRPNDNGYFVAIAASTNADEGQLYYYREGGGGGRETISEQVFFDFEDGEGVNFTNYYPAFGTDAPDVPGGSNGEVTVNVSLTGIPDGINGGHAAQILDSDGNVVASTEVNIEPEEGSYSFSYTFQNIPPGDGYTFSLRDRTSDLVRATSSAFSIEAGTNPPVDVNQAYGDGTGGTGEAPENEPNCESENSAVLGWIFCPTLDSLVGVLSGLTVTEDGGGFLGSILNFSLNDGNQRDALEVVWSGFRALANLLFAIAFLVIIYSAASGNVLSAYDVKRLLPRLVIAAIGVQLSLAIATWLLDFSNDLGMGAQSLLLAPLPDDAGNAFIPGDIGTLWGNVLGGAIRILFVILGIIIALFSILGILLMAVIFIIRNMAILVLIVLAPIAFVAWILPNSEKLFRKWWDWYIQLLMLFPIAALFLGAGKLISYVWIGDGSGIGGDGGGGPAGALFVGTIALFAPYYLAPKMLTLAGGAVRQIANGAENAKNKVGQMEFAQRARARGKSVGLNTASKGLEKTFGKVGTYDKDNAFRQGLSKVGGKTVGRFIGRNKALSRVTARASQEVSKFDSEDAGAAKIKLLERETEERDRAAAKARDFFKAKLEDPEDSFNYAEDSAEFAMAVNGKADEASVDYFTEVLKSDAASDFDKRAAANILGVKFSHDEKAVGALRDVVQGGRASSRAKDQRLAAQIVEDNTGVYMPGLGHILKGDNFVTVGVEATNLASGSVKDIGARSRPEIAATLANQFYTQASNSSTRNQTDLSKVTALAEKMRERVTKEDGSDFGNQDMTAALSRLGEEFVFLDEQGNEIADPKTSNAKIKSAAFKQGGPESTPGPQAQQPPQDSSAPNS